MSALFSIESLGFFRHPIRLFYLFSMRKDHREKFTIVSHRGAEYFDVPALGFKNSVPYVQGKMDAFSRPYRHFARCYFDNVRRFHTIRGSVLSDHEVYAVWKRPSVKMNGSR